MTELYGKHPEWAGEVAAFMVNEAGAESGQAACAEKGWLPLLQDGDGGPWFGAVKGAYNNLVIVNQSGVLEHKIVNVAMPESNAEIESVVAGLL